MLTAATDILGLQVPETNPLFLAALSIHVLAALTCVVAGASAALSTKGSLRHIRAGRLYYWSLTIVFATATTLAAMRWAEDYPLFIIGSIAITAASAGSPHPRLPPPAATPPGGPNPHHRHGHLLHPPPHRLLRRQRQEPPPLEPPAQSRLLAASEPHWRPAPRTSTHARAQHHPTRTKITGHNADH